MDYSTGASACRWVRIDTEWTSGCGAEIRIVVAKFDAKHKPPARVCNCGCDFVCGCEGVRPRLRSVDHIVDLPGQHFGWGPSAATPHPLARSTPDGHVLVSTVAIAYPFSVAATGHLKALC